jgi:hypothetical protein
MTEDSDEVVRRLDRMIAILRLAYRTEIDRAKAAIRSDAVSGTILDIAAEDWVKSGDLQRQVAAATGSSTRTVRSRLQELLMDQALEQRGAGVATEYRSTGLI